MWRCSEIPRLQSLLQMRRHSASKAELATKELLKLHNIYKFGMCVCGGDASSHPQMRAVPMSYGRHRDQPSCMQNMLPSYMQNIIHFHYNLNMTRVWLELLEDGPGAVSLEEIPAAGLGALKAGAAIDVLATACLGAWTCSIASEEEQCPPLHHWIYIGRP